MKVGLRTLITPWEKASCAHHSSENMGVYNQSSRAAGEVSCFSVSVALQAHFLTTHPLPPSGSAPIVF